MLLAVACTPTGASNEPDEGAPKPLPAAAYRVNAALESWVDPDTGYDATRAWELDGGAWPIMLVLSPSQAPQLLAGWDENLFQDALKPHGITPAIEKLDGPPRVFHALERSKWPIVYMPLAVFMDYARSSDNQGGAGGLQYVAVAGSTSGGGYSLLAKDPAITSVALLKGKRVGLLNSNPVPGTLLTEAIQEAGLSAEDVELSFGDSGEQLNRYEKGELDAVVSLNILKAQLLGRGSHLVTDFADVDYQPNYTILAVERSVLEERPEVVDALLEAHYQGHKLAEREWDSSMPGVLRQSWNDYFAGQDTNWSNQRPVADDKAFRALLGNMWPDMRLDRRLIDDCFAFNSTHKTWGWDGTVQTGRLVDYEPFNRVLAKHDERPQ